jgi:dsDNA-specific endonuclease/ATPase MutS2
MSPNLKNDDLPTERSTFEDEVKETIAGVERQIRDLRESVKADIEKLPKKTQETILNKISAIDRQLQSLPYIQERFYETMDKTVTQAKTEVYASVNAMIQQKGLEALGIAPVLMLEDSHD